MILAEFKVINFLGIMIKSGQKGFSLLGVMIAMFITIFGLVGILSFSRAALHNISMSKTKLIAAGLAQEGVEIVRSLRAAYPDWNEWHSQIPDGDCYLQYNSQCLHCCPDAFHLCPGFDNPLKFDPTSYLYQYNSGNDTAFFRKVTLTKISDNELKVVVEVKYLDYKLTVEDRLWNWK